MPANRDPITGEQTEGADEHDGLSAAVVHNEDTADRRTVYPADADEHELLTHWFTADANSFVDPRDFR